MLRLPPILRLKLAVVALTSAMGCQPKIGDECSTAIDCSTLGDRLCDTSQPDGYCTVFNCEPDTCPDEATCVAFTTELDPACGAADDGRHGRFGRTFCMRTCTSGEDCRSGYECVAPRDKDATVIDQETSEDNPQDTRVCIAISSQAPNNGTTPSACFPNEPNELPDGYEGSGGSGGIGGMGGMSAGGMGGMSAGGMGGMSAGGAGGAGGAGTGGAGTGGAGTGGTGGS